ncbi:hypothetical protein BCR34DRAFT_600870 [Clohesyomyces aquaticus]|uniref:Uncharacterized protein n=1 Tax=Clohesyomyces aquaticus TaxID=1231657 RepID=A0A1Y1ZPF1_9PLEO|nr:hypothetical protein BCR34DRAFT_600870 [Clohesyomyces aquaticus]
MKTAFILLSITLTALAAPTTQLSDDPPHDRRRLKAHPHPLGNDVYVKPTLARRSPDCIPLGKTNKKRFETLCIASSNLPSEITLDADFCVAKGGNTCELDDGSLVEDVCFDKRCLDLSDRRALPEATSLKRRGDCFDLSFTQFDVVESQCIADIESYGFGPIPDGVICTAKKDEQGENKNNECQLEGSEDPEDKLDGVCVIDSPECVGP